MAAGVAALVVSCHNSGGGNAPPPNRFAVSVEVPYPGQDSHYLSLDTTLYVAPTDALRVPHPLGAKGDVSNIIGRMRRGETFAVAATQGEWSQIIKADGSTGWIKTATTVSTKEAVEATLVADVSRFERPDPQSLAEGKVLAGQLLLIVGSEGDFVEVSTPDGEKQWIRAEHVVTDAKELAVAREISKVRWSKGHRDILGPYYSTVARAVRDYSQTRLITVLRQEAKSEINPIIP
ncbi:MAG: hypothetical protein R3C68_07990 [Myxococcota bacterium]